jgi:hypothetical protein
VLVLLLELELLLELLLGLLLELLLELLLAPAPCPIRAACTLALLFCFWRDSTRSTRSCCWSRRAFDELRQAGAALAPAAPPPDPPAGAGRLLAGCITGRFARWRAAIL